MPHKKLPLAGSKAEPQARPPTPPRSPNPKCPKSALSLLRPVIPKKLSSLNPKLNTKRSFKKVDPQAQSLHRLSLNPKPFLQGYQGTVRDGELLYMPGVCSPAAVKLGLWKYPSTTEVTDSGLGFRV